MSEPRHLTRTEIEDVVSALHAPPGLTDIQSEYSLEHLKYKFRKIISTIKLVPEAIPHFKKIVGEKQQGAFISPGEMVGMQAATALQNKINQAMLSSVNESSKAGKGVGNMVDLLTNILRVSKNTTGTNSTIHYLDNPTLDMLILRIGDVISSNVEDFVIGIELEEPSVFFPDGHLDDFYYIYSLIFDVDIPKSVPNEIIGRIHLNTLKMVERRTTISDIVKVLDEVYTDLVVIYHSSSLEGIIDIWPNSQSIYQSMSAKAGRMPREAALSTFFNNSFNPSLAEIHVKGIQNIRNITIRKDDIWSLLFWREEKMESNSNWKILTFPSFPLTGTPWKKVLYMFDYTGFEIIKDWKELSYKYLEVKMPKDASPEDTPNTYMKKLIDLDAKNNEEYEKESISLGRDIIVPKHAQDSLHMALKNYHFYTYGTNLMDILSLPNVSPTCTTNNFQEVMDLFGIEAARLVYLYEFMKLSGFERYPDGTKDVSDVNDSHLSLIADVVTHYGILMPMTHSGAEWQDRSALSKLTFQRQINVMVSSSLGIKSKVGGVSDFLILGSRPKIGPSFEREERPHLRTNQSEQKGVSAQDVSKIIEERKKVSSAQLEDHILTDKIFGEQYRANIGVEALVVANDDEKDRDNEDMDDEELEILEDRGEDEEEDEDPSLLAIQESEAVIGESYIEPITNIGLPLSNFVSFIDSISPLPQTKKRNEDTTPDKDVIEPSKEPLSRPFSTMIDFDDKDDPFA